MYPAVKQRLRNVKRNLTSLDDQPLGRVALILVILLDLFILSSIFDGLDKHTAQLTHASEYIPGICRDIVIRNAWNPANRLDRLSHLVETQSTSYYRPIDEKKEIHPTCRPFMQGLDAITNDKELASGLKALHRLGRETDDLRAQIERIKGTYDTALLETVAQQPQQPGGVDALKQEIARKTPALNDLARRRAAIEVSLQRHPQVRRFWTLLDDLPEASRLQLRDELRTFNFWYPVKRLGMELIFLLPLIAVFYLWNSASIRNTRSVQTLVSSHLLVVTVIPVVFKLAELVYDVIPKKLLQRLVELLESLRLIALWHYLVMALAIAAAVVLIYVFQRKLFSREKSLERRIAKGLCQHCGRGLPPGSTACSFCGFAQLKTCAHCGKPTYVFAKFCKECGAGPSVPPTAVYP